MSTLTLTNTSSNVECNIFDNITINGTSSLLINSSSSRDIGLSSFEIIFIAACSSFITLIFAALFHFLKINIKQQTSQWRAPCKPNMNDIINKTKQLYITFEEERKHSENLINHQSASLSSFPPQNRYYPIVSSAFKLFLEAINGTERDGWIYQGEKKGVKKYKKDIHSSPFSLFRGEAILNYPQNILIHAIRDKRIRLLVGDGQMRDCGALEIIDENCKIEYEEYKSPAPFVGARDFVYIDTIHRIPDGTILSFARSVLHPLRPKTNKFTRADLKIGGWALKPIPNEANKTKVLYLVRCDLGGSVPSWIINQITSDIPITVDRLNNALKKIGDIQEFDKPLMDVLLYGPKIETDELKNDDIDKIDNIDNKKRIKKNGFRYPQSTNIQKQRFAAILRENKDFWSSKEYLDLIPLSDINWIKRRPILIGGTLKEHEELLDNFIIPDKPFKYKVDIQEAFKLFNKWRKWKNGKEWKEKAQKEDMKIYNHSIPNETIDIIKGEAIIPYTTPIIAGILLNPYHRRKWDGKLDEVIKIGKSSQYSHIIYISIKTPTIFVTYRDMIAITFIYPFPDGSLIMGSRSIIHPKYPPKKTRVRATINLDLWHIRPLYESNTMHSKITHYAHVSLGGSLPNWIVNEASVDMPSGILKVRNYIKSIYSEIHKPGILYIPPWPYLKSMGINIGWMDMDPLNNKFNIEEKKEEQYQEKQERIVIVEDEKEEKEEKKDEKILNIKNKHYSKSPALHFVSDRQRKLSQTDMDITTNINNTRDGSVASSSIRRHRQPNYNLMVANPMQNTVNTPTHSQNTSGSSNNKTLKTPKTPKTPKTSKFNNNNNNNNDDEAPQIILTRQQWEKGGYLKLNEIKIENAALQSMYDNNNNNNNNIHDKKCKYSLISSLSVRDAASYMTLANCAVSELLQETDPSSKEYWVPSDTKTPRGIYIYKFIHSRERYYHYMGKAILHHEPKFIYDAICDPSFRYQYDKMLDEMQIIDKLDNNTYIARYLHTNKQCYIKQERETIAVIRHRCVCNNDKYVAAGMSIEHKQFPTEIGIKTFKQIDDNNNDNNNDNDNDNDDDKLSISDISNISKQLSGKGPSKSVNNGILRMDIKSSGWVIERNVKKPTDSIVSYIININFGGSVPSAMLKSIAKKQPLAIFYLGKALKHRAKKLKQKRKQLKAQRLQQQQKQQQQDQNA